LLFEGRTLDFLKQREAALRGQTLGQVNGVLPHTLDPAKFVEVVGGSFAGAKP
jgi:predicted Zn-dependent peptidase